MSGNENWIVGSALLGMSLVLGATAAAMEPNENGALAQSSASSSLPTFLDGAHIPSLHDLWKRGDVEADTVPKPGSETLGEDRPENVPESLSAATAAVQPAEAADGPIATVRQRAEELSQRFGGGADTPMPAQHSDAKIATGTLPNASASTAKPKQGEQTVAGAPAQTNDSKPAAGDRATAVPPQPKVKSAAIPPIPLRAPRIAQAPKAKLPPKSRVGAVPRSKTPVVAPAKEPASPQFSIPSQLQSFGWDVQVRAQ